MNINCPIGVFDSGIGGLTVAHAIHSILPNENIVYFGDTAHAPWGNQSQLAIIQYALHISEVLLRHDCKVIVIACNTASATAYDAVTQHLTQLNSQVYLLNVIDPLINYVAAKYSQHNIGIIGTKQTIHSRAYEQKLQAVNSTINLKSLATPLLAPLVEEGFVKHQATQLILHEYLSNDILQDIKALILGCTHYPLLQQAIKNYYLQNNINNIEIINSANIVAQQLKNLLTAQQLLAVPNIAGATRLFYVSDDSQFFNKVAKRLFSQEITLVKY